MAQSAYVLAFAMASTITLLGTGASAQPAQSCLRQDMVNGWKVVNDQTLIVTDRVGKQYTLQVGINIRGCSKKQVGGTVVGLLGRIK